MTIASVTDWNARIVMCACCEMPEHPEPRTESEWVVTEIYLNGVWPPGTPIYSDPAYSTETMTYSDGGTRTTVLTNLVYVWVAGTLVSDTVVYTTTDVPPLTGTVVTTYTGPMTFAEARDIGIPEAIANMDFSVLSGFGSGLKSSSRADRPPMTETFMITLLIMSRYRLGVPDGYAAPYYKIECDEVLFPADPEVPSSLVTSRSWEYAGTDEFSDWFELDPPDVPGEIRVCNLRVTSYHTPWGTKPQFIGERWTPPG